MDTRYELVLAPAAVRALLSLSDPARMELAGVLGTELLNGPNARKEAFYDVDLRACRRERAVYTATPLSYDAFVAVHRPLSEDELATLVHREIAPLLGIRGDPVMSRVTHYECAVPQYNLGHTALLHTAQQAISALPGLFVTGNYWNGPAIGACVEHSVEVAEQVRLSYNT